MHIAYLINQYPKVSHTFIRREIDALERTGLTVHRHALRGWDAEVADPADRAERGRTHYLLQGGMPALAGAVLRMLWQQPVRFLRTLALAARLSWRSDRPAPLWAAYLAEACVLAHALRASGVRHVHAHFGTNSTSVALLASSLGACSYSFTVHGPEEFDRPEFIHLGEKIARARFVVAISSYGRSQLYRWAPPAHWHKVQVVRCGLEAAFHHAHQTPVPEAPQLVCVGRLCEQKGQLLLIEAAAVLRARGRAFRLILAGDGPLRAPIEALIHQHELRREVQITGWISSDEVRRLLLASRALVLPSFAEGLPVVIMEALSLHRPVITTAIAGIPELVVNGRNGWLVTPGSIDALVQAMDAALDASPAQLQAMGQAGHDDVLAAHDVDVEAARLAALLRPHASA